MKMMNKLTQWFTRMTTCYLTEISPSVNNRTYKFETLNETLRSLRLECGLSSEQLLQYIKAVDELISFQRDNPSANVTDPRELPRPQRSATKICKLCSKNDSQKFKTSNIMSCCSCHNCDELTLSYTECAICVQPLCSGSSESRLCVTSCLECGNVACSLCAAKLLTCPYCRSQKGLQPNFALQRLINKLEMPCLKSSSSRMDIESGDLEFNSAPLSPVSLNGRHAQVLCLHKNCQWNGALVQLAQHMSDSHACIVSEESSCSLIITEFKRKTKLSATKPRTYCLIISYLSDVFVCKIVLMGTKIKLVLVSVSRVENTNFGLWVEIVCNKKKLQGVVPLLKKRANVSICVQNLMSYCKKKSDAVTINLTIRSLS